MSHAITSTKEMASSNNSRSFTTVGTSSPTDSKIGSSTLHSTFGSTNKTWGTNNIWGNGVLSNGFPKVATDGPRDKVHQGGMTEADPTERKTGSGSLVESSVSDDWNYRTAWGSKRSMPSARSTSHATYPDATMSQQRSISSAGLPQSFASASPNGSAFAPRPQLLNPSTTATTQSRSSYASTFYSSLSGTADQPPKVYTKFDRPIDPHARMPPDSAKAGLRPDQSPTEERNTSFTMYSGGRISLPGSRHGSQPPSRHSDDRPFFTKPDYSRPAQRQSHSTSRTTSLSSQSNGFGPPATPNTDHLTYPFNQLSINGDSRPSTSHKPLMSTSTFFPSSNSYFGHPFSPAMLNGAIATETADDPDNLGRMDFDYLGVNDCFSPQQSQLYPDYSNTTFGSDILQHQKGHQHQRSNRSLSNGKIPASQWDTMPGPRVPNNWPAFGTNMALANRLPPIPQGEHAYLDPSMQDLQSSPLRNPYTAYNSFILQNSIPLGSPAQFLPYMPTNLSGVVPPSGLPDPLTGEGVQSSVMYRFKTDPKAKHWEIKEIYGHIPEFSGDQHGSRFIQSRLESANSDEKEHIFREIQPNAIPLMTDVFGNYVIQKFFEHGDQTHKKILASKMRGQVLSLSLQMYGCRVVQKALDHVLVDQQAQLVRELEGSVLRCVKDQNGNHVIQKAIERCPPGTIDFVIHAFRGQVQHLSIHAYGCRVIQRCLERCEPHSKAMIMMELVDGIPQMISDQYGNYVVQHVVEHDSGDARKLVLNIVARGLESYSKHKFASNVVEKCLIMADDDWRRHVVFSLANEDHRKCEGEGALVGLIKDNFGNYVIQKLLDTLSPTDYTCFLDVLQPAMTQAKRSGCGKQVLSIEKKMHRFPAFRESIGNVGPYNGPVYQLSLPTPPFASHYTSAATTPPPLTADTSLQSSAIPSINGDAVEGAALGGSSKTSDIPMDSHYLR